MISCCDECENYECDATCEGCYECDTCVCAQSDSRAEDCVEIPDAPFETYRAEDGLVSFAAYLDIILMYKKLFAPNLEDSLSVNQMSINSMREFLWEKLQELSNENDEFKESIVNTQQNVDKMRLEFESNKNKMESLEKENVNLSTSMIGKDAELERLRREIETLKSELRVARAVNYFQSGVQYLEREI